MVLFCCGLLFNIKIKYFNILVVKRIKISNSHWMEIEIVSSVGRVVASTWKWKSFSLLPKIFFYILNLVRSNVAIEYFDIWRPTYTLSVLPLDSFSPEKAFENPKCCLDKNAKLFNFLGKREREEKKKENKLWTIESREVFL